MAQFPLNIDASVQRAATRLWHSPTFTTWASFGARSANLALVLPIAMATLAAEELQMWQLLVTVVILFGYFDFGLSPTFLRLFAKSVSEKGGSEGESAVDWERMERIWRTMSALYARISWAAILLSLTLGPLFLARPIRQLEDPVDGWLAWAAVVGITPVYFHRMGLGAYLQGCNHVALLRRWEGATALGGVLSSLIVLSFNGGFLILFLTSQAWGVLDCLIKRFLARYVNDGRAKSFGRPRIDGEIWETAWPATWRSAIGTLSCAGLIQASGLIYAQFAEPATVASYLVALRYLTAIGHFSRAPFYSKIPSMARFHAQGKVRELLALALRGMRLSNFAFVAAALGVGVAMPMITEKEAWVDSLFWWLMSFGFLVERVGAMHLQLYSVTNIIVWHIANGVSGLIIVVSTALLAPKMGLWSFPFGIMSGYLGFYAWFCVRLASREFQFKWWRFERASSILAGACLIAGAALHVNFIADFLASLWV